MAELTDAQYAKKRAELSDLQDRWEEEFRQTLGVGVDVTIADIRRCLAAGSPKELNDRIRRDVDAGLIF